MSSPDGRSGGHVRVVDPAGQLRHVQVVVRSLLADSDVSGVVITTRDVTESVELESTLADLALHDPLTGLPNRASFIDRVDQVLAARARDGLLVAVMFCDLDQFKTINDTLGQAVGDDVLRAVAERLRGATRGHRGPRRW